jgi:hypothetical protein
LADGLTLDAPDSRLGVYTTVLMNTKPLVASWYSNLRAAAHLMVGTAAIGIAVGIAAPAGADTGVGSPKPAPGVPSAGVVVHNQVATHFLPPDPCLPRAASSVGCS